MKRLGAILLGVTVIMESSIPILAKENLELYIDGTEITTQSYTYIGANGNVEGKYYMDVLPQLKNERAYAPLSTITKLLGINAVWNNPTITINNDNTEIILTIGKKEAKQNGEDIQLDAAPYIENGRTMIPLRFISEAFGLEVDYKDSRIDISSSVLKSHDTTISALQTEYWMTMGSKVLENRSNLCTTRTHEIIHNSQKEEVAEPNVYSRTYMIDEPDSYVLLRGYYFVNSENQPVEQFEIYQGLSFGMSTGVYMIRDVMNAKWYSFTSEAYNELIDLLHIGNWETISNTIV
ncbi:MAG: stalk domain-containing protein [Zhenhengia sp.]|uniref:stalk domain-containing protein n=1 Tax=Zhenhengia sp. TaxID=2944208 RepID=UPI003993066D